jgi:hypothetical protein
MEDKNSLWFFILRRYHLWLTKTMQSLALNIVVFYFKTISSLAYEDNAIVSVEFGMKKIYLLTC